MRGYTGILNATSDIILSRRVEAISTRSVQLAGIADLDNILHNIIVHGPGSSIIVGLQAVKLQVCFVIHVEIGNIEKKTPNITFFTSINELVLLRNQ